MAEFKPTTKLNAWQTAIAKAYADGDFAFVIEHPEEIDTIGDTLFQFLMIELSSDEDCHTKEDAMTRISAAIRDLDTALDAVDLTPEVTIQ